jgi:hypothetical protein
MVPRGGAGGSLEPSYVWPFSLGIEKLWEWSPDGTDGWGAKIVGQVLLMAAERGPRLGYGVDDLVRFLRTAAGGGEEGGAP